MNKNNNEVVGDIRAVLSIGMISTLLFFVFPIIITYDTAHYFNYVNILNGTTDISEWDVVRGLGYPLILYIGLKLFGNGYQGILLINYITYITFIIYGFKMLRLYISNKKTLFWSMLVIVINPLVLGYYHSLLTEAYAITGALVTLYYLLKSYMNKSENKKSEFIFLGILYACMTVLLWHIKQPYILLIIAPLVLLIAYCIKDRAYMIGLIKVLIGAMIAFVISVILWGQFIDNVISTYDEHRTSSSMFSVQLIDGLSRFNYEQVTDYTDVPEKVVKKLQPEKIIWKITSHNKEKSTYMVVSERPSIVDAIRYGIKCVGYSPLTVLESYKDNYFIITNLYRFMDDVYDINETNVDKHLSLWKATENEVIGYRTFRVNEAINNVFYMTDELYANIARFDIQMESPILGRGIIKVTSKLANITFTLLGILAPIVFIWSFFVKDKMLRLLMYIGSGTHFLNIMMFTVLNGIIDRYAVTTYMISFILIIPVCVQAFRKVKGLK